MGNKICGNVTTTEFQRVVDVLQSDLQRHEEWLARLDP